MSDTVTSPSSPAFLQNGRRHPPSRPLLSDFDKRHCGNSEPFVQSPDHFERVAFSSLAPEVDAQQLEDAFKSRLATLATGEVDLKSPAQSPTSKRQKAKKIENGPLADGIDKSALTLSEPRRIRDRDHVKSVARHPCLICGRRPSDAHHLRFAQSRALGRKVSDEYTVPLCRGHHREVHRCGDEAAWWRNAGVDPTIAARALWLDTHPLAKATSIAVVGTDNQSAVATAACDDNGKPVCSNSRLTICVVYAAPPNRTNLWLGDSSLCRPTEPFTQRDQVCYRF